MPTTKRFCPLRSTASSTADCSEKCMWYVESDNDYTCAVPLILSTQGTIIEAVENTKKK